MNKSVKIFIIFNLFVFAKAYGFSEFRSFESQEWQLKWLSQYYFTNANYEKSGGTYSSLPAGYSYKLFETELGARYNFNSFWSGTIKSQIGFAESKDLVQTRNNSQINNLQIASDFLLLDEPLKLIPEINLVLPITKNPQNSVQTHEGSSEAHARLIGLYDFKQFSLQSFLGFHFRNEQRSSLLVYGIGSEYILDKSYFGIEARGFSTAISDQAPATRETESLNVNGKSAMFNTTNPSLLEAHLWYGYQGVHWGFEIGIAQTINGANSAAYTQAMGLLSYRFQKSKSKTSGFIEDTQDDVDQNLFKNPSPTQEKTPNPVKNQPAKNIKDELNKTEMHIELKKKKRRK
jgi:hypothetical protein